MVTNKENKYIMQLSYSFSLAHDEIKYQFYIVIFN